MVVAPACGALSSIVRRPVPTTLYQLVLQFRGETIPSLDDLIELEDQVVVLLGDSAEVDGHDYGNGEANIFILTSDPHASLGQVLPYLRAQHSSSGMLAAFRAVNGDSYSVLWPSTFQGTFSVL